MFQKDVEPLGHVYLLRVVASNGADVVLDLP